jgi:tetratricopeptide (TPR) repeat protein
VIAVLLLGLGCIQFASDALYGASAAPHALPARIPQTFGLAVYGVLDRVAPAPYVEASLARAALARGDVDAAQRYAIALPASPTRDELLAQCAQARGVHLLALEYFIAAPDVDAVQAEIARMAQRDPESAYAFETRFRNRLIALTTHPDAVADAYWIAGDLATKRSWHPISQADRAAWAARALNDYRIAAQQAPLNVKYALATANQALSMGNYDEAQRWYAHGVNVDPQSADSLAGLGLVALRRGDRALAMRYAERARVSGARAALLMELERELQ